MQFVSHFSFACGLVNGRTNCFSLSWTHPQLQIPQEIKFSKSKYAKVSYADAESHDDR